MSLNKIDVEKKSADVKTAENGTKYETKAKSTKVKTGATFIASIAEPEEVSVTSHDSEKPPLAQQKSRRDKTHPRKKQATCLTKTTMCVRSCCVYTLSYIGLTCLVVAYSVLGGFVFVELERDNEEKVQEKAVELRHHYADDIESTLAQFCDSQPTCNISFDSHVLINTFRQILRDFQNETYMLVNREGWAGVRDDVDGDHKWTFAGALLFSVTVITTIGYGYAVPKTTAGRAVTMVYALIGIPLTVLCITKIGKAMASLVRALYNGTICVECRRKFIKSVGTTPNDDDGDEPSASGTHEHAEVPILICLGLAVWYIMFGSIMFTIWEDWTYFTGAYFCFITLSTIGFGDVVPGFSHKDWNDQVKQVACSLYLLLGLSVLAMCFDLMQKSVLKLFNRLGRCAGLVKEDE